MNKAWIAATAALFAVGCSASPTSGDTPSSSSPSPTPALSLTPTPTAAMEPTSADSGGACLVKASAMSLDDQVGQLYMMAVQTGTPVETAVASVKESRPGAVILLGNWTLSIAEVNAYTEQLRAGSDQPLLIGVDQEGGLVQRLQGTGFEKIPAASAQTTMDAAALRTAWAGWGAQLTQAGVDWDLAPVADVVPAANESANEPVAQLGRGYGSDPDHVSSQVSAVVNGLADAKVASSVKHFPGLGQVRQNTDLAVAHDAVSTLSPEELAPFQAAVDAGASSVMVSSAIYDNVDAANPAVFSQTVVTGILRERMGFEGLVVSDDLGVAAAVAEYPIDQRGNLFLEAGGDLVIVADPAATQQMIDGTLAKARADKTFADSLAPKVARVLELKQSRGMLSCG